MSELAIRQERLPVVATTTPSRDELATLMDLTRTIADTDFVPRALRGKKAAVLACILYGREIGLGPMKSLQEIDMIQGTPSESAALVSAKVRAAGHKLWRGEHRDDNGALVAVTAHGERSDGTRDSYTFTWAMAERAKLTGKDNWKHYPEAMLWARAVTQLARFLFADVFLGSVYTADEAGAERTDENGRLADIDDDGVIVEDVRREVGESRQVEPVDGPSAVGAATPAARKPNHAKLAVLIAELEQAQTMLPEADPAYESWEDYSRRWAQTVFGVQSRAELTAEQMDELIGHMNSMVIPF